MRKDKKTASGKILPNCYSNRVTTTPRERFKYFSLLGSLILILYLVLTLLTLNIFLVTPVSAVINKPAIISEPYFEQSTDVTIRVPCTSEGVTCSNITTCYCNIIDPDQEILLNDYTMTRNGAYFEANLTANQTGKNGEYELNVYCSDGNGNHVSRFLNFFVTPSGVPQSTGRGIFYIGLFLLLIVLFVLTIVGFIRSNHILPKFALFLAGYLLLLALTFIGWNMAYNFLENAPFLVAFFRILFWVFLIGMIPVVFGSLIWVGYLMLTIKQVKTLMERGIPEDEALARVKNKRF
jgi:hypothetical protein